MEFIICFRPCVKLIGQGIDSDALHACMRLLLRLTCAHPLAALFAHLGGVRSLLALKQIDGFAGFSSLATLLIRHTIEDANTLQYTMEKVG